MLTLNEYRSKHALWLQQDRANHKHLSIGEYICKSYIHYVGLAGYTQAYTELLNNYEANKGTLVDYVSDTMWLSKNEHILQDLNKLSLKLSNNEGLKEIIEKSL